MIEVYRFVLILLSQIQSGMESCVVKSIMSGGAGFVIGGAFGAFMASVSARSVSTFQQID